MIAERLDDQPPLHMTEAEFDAWCMSTPYRVEFVNGQVIWMSPVSLAHDEIKNFIGPLLRVFLDLQPVDQICGSELLVRLGTGLRRVPDLLFVSSDRHAQLKSTYLDGAPDAAWEIVSPDSVARDWRDKFREYEQAGVREYWIVDPAHATVALYRLKDGHYVEVEAAEGRLHSEVIPGFWLDPEWLWSRPMPKVLDCLRRMGLNP